MHSGDSRLWQLTAIGRESEFAFILSISHFLSFIYREYISYYIRKTGMLDGEARGQAS